ncbi:MAG: EAL domain-containing protein [Spirochaetales bacterium]|nr:EAL domain-containing protein [Spirochaetales bacterium]
MAENTQNTDKDAQQLKKILDQKEGYIEYLENLTLAHSSVQNLSEEERKNADLTIHAYQELQTVSELELKEKNALIEAHQNLMQLSSTELMHKNTIFQNILEINQYISTIIEEEVVLKKTLENLIGALRFRRGILFLRHGSKLVPRILIRLVKEDIADASFSHSMKAIRQAVKERKRVFWRNTVFTKDRKEEFFSLLCLPLVSKNRLLGLIYTDLPVLECLTAETELDIAEIFSTQAVISIENMVLYRMLKQQAIIDRFTGLPNRKKLEIDAEVPGTRLLSLINIDSFSSINLAYGLEAGNRVLKIIAERLQNILPPKTTLYKLSGDEFVILSKNETFNSDMMATLITKTISGQPIEIDDNAINLSISIGLVENEDKNLMRKADIALKLAKKRGHGYYIVYNEEFDLINRYRDIFVWVNKVKNAVEHDKMVPFYQGIRNNETGEFEIYECLVRILDNKEVITPRSFLGPAKEVGLYNAITLCMIDKCFSHFADREGLFALNLSHEDFSNTKLIGYINDKLQQYQIAPSRIIFEVLEEISLKNNPTSFDFLRDLKSLGVKIAIDDFGLEYSNFSRLLMIQADYIKIAGAFTRRLDTDLSGYKIVRAMSDFAHAMGAQVIAEFVYSHDVQNKVLELGIEYSQGNLFSMPAPHTDLPPVPFSHETEQETEQQI